MPAAMPAGAEPAELGRPAASACTLRYMCIAGPTASGKSAVAMAIAAQLAARLPVEIVSVDSALVYRGMDIGTAKPSAGERERVPHHLLDIVDPAERYSAARFVADARQLIGEIAARGALPLLVGGTMLYFKALFDGLDALPEADAQVRADIDRQAAREGWPALHGALALADPAAAARIGANDAQRIQRALEVLRITGRPMSSWQTAPARGDRPPLIALEPGNRAWLHARIEARFGAMLEAGFIDEVRALRERGDLHAETPSMRAVGYRQAWQALDSGTLPALRERAVAATRQLAKRQLTWLRAMPWREVVAADENGAIEQAVALAVQHAARIAALAPTRPTLC